LGQQGRTAEARDAYATAARLATGIPERRYLNERAASIEASASVREERTMAISLNPYLSFRGNAREAIEFYQDVFGAKATVSTFAELNAVQDPSEADLVMHADIEGPEGIRFFASDTPNRMEYQEGSNFSMSLSGQSDSEGQLSGYFDKLADGGTVLMPLEKAVWGDTFGMCKDRFGITWLVNIGAATTA
jgi:PhnB protein